MHTIRNIYCIGRNYRLHAKELGNEVPEAPLVFLKPTHSLAKADGRVLSLPGTKGEVHYEAEWVLRISRPVASGTPVDEVVSHMGLGIDFTLRDVQSGLKKKGHPWLPAKGFPNAAVLTDLKPFPGLAACASKSFSLFKNQERVQKGTIDDMVFPRNNWWITARHTLGWAKETLFLPVRRLVWGRWRITIISGWIGKTNHGENAKSG